jgi:hypothetical protein
MKNLAIKFFNDDAGFVVSSELILIATIAVLSLVVGLAEVSHGVNQELEDVGSAVGSFQQSYSYQGLYSHDKSAVVGSYFSDERDFCDSQFDIAAASAVAEGQQDEHLDY